MHSLPIEPAVIEFSHCSLCIFLPPELRERSQGQQWNSRSSRDWLAAQRLDWI
jgi:hypothetical protein